jgi:hypothetical protein
MRPVTNVSLLVGIVFFAHVASGEHVLIPVFISGNETPRSWKMQAAIANHSTSPVTARDSSVSFSLVCPIPEGCWNSEIPPGAMARIEGLDAPGGVLLNVADRRKVSISVRVISSPSGLKVAGAELPIAGESDFTEQPIEFADVPLGRFAPGERRVHLRVYSLSNQPVRIRLESRAFWPGTEFLYDSAEFELLPQPPPSPPQFLFVDLRAALPNAQSGSSYQVVRVIPLQDAGGDVAKIWAFISLTSPTDDIAILRPW